MSSNTSNSRASKGSKFWIQTIINSDMRKELERKIGIGEINWLSPLAKDNYAEYKLNQNYIVDAIKIPKANYSFWPNNQPQWDAIGIIENTLVLVEAKAHLKEMKSGLKAQSEVSENLIRESMERVFNSYITKGNYLNWEKTYYQLGNRLTFLKTMNDFMKENVKQVKLVLLNIVDDPTYIPTTEKEWNDSYKDIFKDMTGSAIPPKDVIVVNFKV